jgi:branched-chain amino acid transport system ATP-binding protein
MAGVNVVRMRVIAWLASALVAGLAGGVYAWYVSVFYPDNVFSGEFSIFAIVFALFGGVASHKLVHRGINRTFQVPKPFLSLTVRQNIEVALAYGRAEVAPPAMAALLDEYRLTEVAERPAADLNNAQQKMLDLVRALATRPRLLLLDELAAGLNPAELDWIAERIKALARSGIAIIVVEHLMGFIEHITDRVIVMNAGKEIFEGKLAVAVQVPQVIEVFLGGEHAV